MSGRDRAITGFVGVAAIAAIVGLSAGPDRNAAAASSARSPSPDSAPGAARHPDAEALATWSELAGVPVRFTFALAWEETRDNPDPTVRGKHGEWGRFQIKESTARARCPRFDIRTSAGNVACFLAMAREDRRTCGGWWCAARIHNGNGWKARAYADRVVLTVGLLALWEGGR